MPAEYLGKGCGFPVSIQSGSVAMADYDESIRQSVWIILGTARGERVMNPEFGCGIHDFVFRPWSAATRGLIAYEVRHALAIWEPRIETVDVKIRNSGAAGEVVEIDIEYTVIPTNSRQNLVFPFYLERRPR
jgi:phage baseplate assembly protein W